MKNPFSYLFRARDKPQNAVSTAPSFYFGMSGSGKSVSPSSAIQVSAVYACVRVIAETIASLPFHVYEATDEGSRKAVEHPLYRLIHDEPNLEMTSFIWRETMLTHLLLYRRRCSHPGNHAGKPSAEARHGGFRCKGTAGAADAAGLRIAQVWRGF